MEIVAAGPSPGSTPMIVPKVHPSTQTNRFEKEREIANPDIKLSIMTDLSPPLY
jgi:hypothetical protein